MNSRNDIPIPQMVRTDGTYPTVELRKDKVSINIVQTRSRPVDPNDPEPLIRENLDHLLNSIDKAQGRGRADLVCFHEFPLQGGGRKNREQYLKVARYPECKEIEAIGQRAKKYDCYIAFGCLIKEEDWPGHVMNMQILMGPEGNIVARHWKQRAKRGTFRHSEQITTCIYDVFDRFVEMYGWDEVIPVARTDIGNIAMSPVQYEPELFRAQALKGAEILVRPATGGFRWEDTQMCSYHHDVYTVVVNNALNIGYENREFFVENAPRNDWVGRSSIFGPKGEVLAKAGPYETKRRAVIDMKAYRERHRIPDFHLSMYRHVFDQYEERYKPNTWAKYLPDNAKRAADYLHKRAAWHSFWYDD